MNVVDALAQLSWHVQSQLNDAAAAEGLSVSQLRLLGILRDREPEMLELAAHLRLDKSSVTGLVTRAEARGLVERVPSATDGRRVAVRLTESGRMMAEELERDVTRRLAAAVDGLTLAQQETFVSLAAKLIELR